MAKSSDQIMKEIGSIFPLSNDQIKEASILPFPSLESCKIYFSLCREALYDIAKSFHESNKIALLPSYTCQTVITPFKEAGWTCHFYSIHKDLHINIKSLQEKTEEIKPSIIVVHPYFGMDFNLEEIKALKSTKSEGTRIIIDITQCIFSKQQIPFADYYIGSYRKWFSIPDGAFLSTEHDIDYFTRDKEENKEFLQRQTDAMYLRHLYFEQNEQRIKDISIRLSKSADYVADNSINPHCMSNISAALFLKEDKTINEKRRIQNFIYLSKNLLENDEYEPVCKDISRLTTAPLYFTIFVKDRKRLQLLLAKESIYAPVIWPVEDTSVLIDKDTIFIYEHLLAIPCDQRYDIKDMKKISEVINNYRI